jgi:hypothetical protein
MPMPFTFLALAAAQSFAAGTPAFDPRLHKADIAGSPAQVLVLGTPHLSQLPQTLDPKLLEPLLDRLARFKPEVITVEALSGEECEILLRFKPQHGTAWDDYCWPTEDIEKETGLSVPAATAEVDRTLASWPSGPTPAQRRHLAMLFIAANERASATVQWLRLPEGERHAGDGLTQAMVEMIERKGKKPNENYAIGATLAARLGLERVYQTDDHIADSPDSDPDYGTAIQEAWNAPPESVAKKEFLRRSANLPDSAAVLGLYRHLNDPETQRATIAADMGRNAKWPSAKLYGRQYLSWWENRNLRMAANVRGAFASKPDAHVLVIIGATHKGYLDAYLDMMQHIQIVDAEQFLK